MVTGEWVTSRDTGFGEVPKIILGPKKIPREPASQEGSIEERNDMKVAFF